MPKRKRLDCGLLTTPDARGFKLWWTARGHAVITEPTARKHIVQVWLTLNKKR